MPSRHDTRAGDVYVCDQCGLEVKVVAECKDVGKPEKSCGCEPCAIACCGEELKKRD